MLSEENKATAERLFKINDRVVDLFALNAIMNAVRHEERDKLAKLAWRIEWLLERAHHWPPSRTWPIILQAQRLARILRAIKDGEHG